MALETKLSLDDEVIGKLQDLIQINQDSYEGFLEAADRIDDKRIAALFRELAADRASQAAELRGLVSANGHEPREKGTLGGAARRKWLDIKSALTGGGAKGILAEMERGEDHVKGQYEDVLKEVAGSAVTDTLNAQYRRIKEAHDRIKALRDAHD
jgi:uncharacterized protein (TIGR02284 family)